MTNSDESCDIKSFAENRVLFLKRMGMKVLVMEPEHVQIMVPIVGNANHLGSMYAGALFSIAEASGGVLFYSTFNYKLFYPVVKEVNIKFVHPAVSDVLVDISMNPDQSRNIASEAEEKGKADFQMEAQVKDVESRIVAVTNSIYQIRRIDRRNGSES